jgi:hypothetical protein
VEHHTHKEAALLYTAAFYVRELSYVPITTALQANNHTRGRPRI